MGPDLWPGNAPVHQTLASLFRSCVQIVSGHIPLHQLHRPGSKPLRVTFRPYLPGPLSSPDAAG